jgi:hypothetical protein
VSSVARCFSRSFQPLATLLDTMPGPMLNHTMFRIKDKDVSLDFYTRVSSTLPLLCALAHSQSSRSSEWSSSIL